MYSLIRPILFTMDAERAHHATLNLLKTAHTAHVLHGSLFELPTTCMGITLPNPVGLAAGLDKNGAYIDALAALGFGFLEVGTVTPKPQEGNPKPRLFRVPEVEGVINRMGFNNDGVDVLIANIQKSKFKGVLGINIGKNADTPVEKALKDYLYCLERVYVHASYITINISSPNTKNLRNLQSGDNLTQLLDCIKNAQIKLANAHGFYVPIALKIAPDLDTWQIDDISQVLLAFEIDGLIATNTTISRKDIMHLPIHTESGGLSGKPVYEKSTQVLAQFAERLEGRVDLIGVGGINSRATAVQKIKAGAKAIQLYSSLVYQGTGLVGECVNAIGEYQNKKPVRR